MRQTIHVISDLHLGGAPGTDNEPAFQMCRPETHQLLAKFIRELRASEDGLESHLVIAGDIVDFLAEEPFMAFTPDPAAACAKLKSIFDRTAVVWDALNHFVVERKGLLTLMLGNHDIELSLPGVREMLLKRLSGKGVRFIYDNEAFTLGPVLIEHGNRFDAWNAVPHGALRRVRSQLSRKQPVSPEFVHLPGSKMVIDIINPLKQQYPFVDLLKPETAVALPIIAALGATGLGDVWDFFQNYRAQLAIDYDEESGEPIDGNYINAAFDLSFELMQAAQEISDGGDPNQVSSLGDLLGQGMSEISDTIRAARIDALYLAFRRLAAVRRLNREAFDVGMEEETYRKPASRALDAGFSVVVYGHTHLPKNVQLGSGTYLNTGTWADVMRIPEGIWDADSARGKALFREFTSDLESNNLEKWRSTLPTYAHIELENGIVKGCALRFADNHSEVDSAEVFARLGGRVT